MFCVCPADDGNRDRNLERDKPVPEQFNKKPEKWSYLNLWHNFLNVKPLSWKFILNFLFFYSCTLSIHLHCYFRMKDPQNDFSLVVKVAKRQMRITFFTPGCCSMNTKWWITHLLKKSGSLGDSQPPPPPSKVPPREFQIVIYLAGSSETAARPGLVYANRYFIPVCGNKNRGWGIRWFSRGKFNAGYSDSWCGAFLVLFFPFFFSFSRHVRAAIERGCPAMYFPSISLIFPDDSFSCISQ